MQYRYFPYIVLYSLGLALFLSLLFNAFLLYNLSGQEATKLPAEPIATALSQKASFWKQQLIECNRDNQSKDSLIQVLQHPVQHTPHTLLKHIKE